MRKFGLLGKKLSHSLSPLLHKVFFEEFGVEAEYNLYEVTETEIDNFKSYMLENSIEGVNITVPYKKVFLDKLDFISDEAKAIGAINLLYIKDNKFYGDNTDYYGFKQTLISNQINPSGKRIAIVGRGGASASVYKVLKDMGAEDITFYFRKDKLSKIEFPKNLNTFNSYSFFGVTFIDTTFIIPDSVNYLGASVFNKSNLVKIIGPNVTEILGTIVSSCNNLESIEYPKLIKVTQKGPYNVLSDCLKLKIINFPNLELLPTLYFNG